MTSLDLVLLDLDRKWTRCQWIKWCERATNALDLLGARVFAVVVEESMHGYHVHLRLDKPRRSEVGLVCLQAILGSDSQREALNLCRIEAGHPDWNHLSVQKKGHRVKPRFDYAAALVRRLRKAGHPAYMDPNERSP